MLIVNGLIAPCDDSNSLIVDGAIKTADDRIVEIGPSPALLARWPAEERLDARGMLILPGLINAYTRLHGSLARGAPPRGAPATDFPQLDEGLWRRLDQAMRPEDIASNAAAALVEAIRHGVTTLIAAHSSSSFVDGSLDILAGEARRAGLRAGLAYAASDREGHANALAGLRENARFIHLCQHQPDPRRAGLMGLNASMTLSEETLQGAVSLARDLDIGCLMPVAQCKADHADSLKRAGLRVVERLSRAGLVNARFLAAHAIHIDAYELDLLRQADAGIIHCPRADMRDAVGVAPAPRLLRDRMTIGLGDAGFSSALFAEMQAAFLLHKSASGDPLALPAEHVTRLAFANNRRIASRIFDQELGILTAGACADIIMLDYQPAVPITQANLAWHLACGLAHIPVDTVICAGKVLLHQAQLTELDEAAIAARARELARKLWARY